MRVGIIGAGLIGKKRAAALQGTPFTLTKVCDQNRALAEALADSYPGVTAVSQPEELIQSSEVDVIFIATRHDSLAQLTWQAVCAQKHVLVEKPAARHVSELEPILKELGAQKVIVRVGYNHRFHPAMQLAKKLIVEGQLGPLMMMRGRYGHGGRLGYESEWRANPTISGGGELIDQGVHLIDLARWYFGDFQEVRGSVKTLFWNMPVEDNAFLELQTASGQVAWLHASCSEWKNLFSLEIYGRNAKIQIDGLGGSYGPERLTHYKMKPEMGPPDVEIHDFPTTDASWQNEIQEFYQDIQLGRTPSPSLHDAAVVLHVVDTLYRNAL